MPLGSGLGTFVPVYQTFEKPSDIAVTYVNHAHNDLLEDLSEVFLPTAGGGMALADASANALLQQAIARNEDNGVVRSIAVPAAKSRPALIVHLLPLRRDAHDIFSGGDILVAATAVSASALVPSPSILSGLFDLSPAEARLAAALATGRSLGEVANESGIAVKSARTYLDRIFQKTGTNRQGQLVALLDFDPIQRGGRVIGYTTSFKRKVAGATPHAEIGLTKFAVDRFRAEGLETVTLGLSPLSGLAPSGLPESAFWRGAFRRAYESKLVNRHVFNLKGQAAFKRRFHGVEEPVYIAFDGAGAIGMLALLRLLKLF